MKVILYMAITVNGMVAKLDLETPFTSDEDYTSFKATCLKTKAVICGRTTFDQIRKDPGFFWPECHYYIVSSTDPADTRSNVTWITFDPKKNIDRISTDGFDEICIMGGGQTNAGYLAARVIDEIYLDIEPYIYLKGIPLFRPLADLETKLELLTVNKLSSQTVQLHYKITK